MAAFLLALLLSRPLPAAMPATCPPPSGLGGPVLDWGHYEPATRWAWEHNAA